MTLSTPQARLSAVSRQVNTMARPRLGNDLPYISNLSDHILTSTPANPALL